MDSAEREPNPTFRCHVLGLGHPPTRSGWGIGLGFLAVVVLLGSVETLTTGPNSWITIKPPGYLLAGLLLGTLIVHLARIPYRVQVRPNGLHFNVGQRLELFVPYAALSSASRESRHIVLARKGGGGVVRLTPGRLTAEDLLDAIQERMHQGRRADDGAPP